MQDFNKEMLTKRPRIDPGHMLRREIKDLKETLVRIDKDSTLPMFGIAKNIERILYILKTISDKKLDIHTDSLYRDSIHDFLSVGPLTRTEIPLDVLNQLISVRFEINCIDSMSYTCLDIAVNKHHYNAIRLLVKHGARSNSDNCKSLIPPVTSLAGQHKVPLDLFDLLATPENLNKMSKSGHESLPLHSAVSHGHIQTALHLIKLGASVDQQDGVLMIPIEYFVHDNYYQLSNGVFMSFLPQKAHGVSILNIMFGFQGYGRQDKDNTCLLEMSHHLLQRLRFSEPLRVKFKRSLYTHPCVHSTPISFLCMVINNVEFCPPLYNSSMEPLAMYLCSLILVKLQVDLIATPREIDDQFKQSATEKELSYVHGIDGVWRSYHQQSHVKSLLRLCILCTRSSMSSLDDASFMSLPVPPLIRKLLTYRDIAEEIFEEWCHGPTISS